MDWLNSNGMDQLKTSLTVHTVYPTRYSGANYFELLTWNTILERTLLKGLQRCHEDWLYYGNSTFVPPSPKVIVINSEVSVEEFARKVIALKDTIIPPYVFDGQ